MVGVWICGYRLNNEGFPQLLYATMQRLGIRNRLVYEGREYEEHDTKHCEVTVCWHFLTSLLEMEVLSPSPTTAPEMPVGIL